MRSRRIILATLVMLPLLTAGCLRDVVRKIAKDISEAKVVQEELSRRFQDEVFVTVNQGGGRVALNVTFTNSPLNDKAREDRLQRAQETMNVVRARYPSVDRLSSIWVIFVRQKKTFIFVDERAAIDYYGFDNNGMRISTSYGPNNTGVELQASTNYLKDDNETDIAVNGIQLAGTPGGNGLTVLPHFRAKGDIRKAKSPPPKVVTFDFASYSNVEEFEPNLPIVFIGDGRTLFKTTATFKVLRTGGTVNESLYLPVPYAAFRSIVASSQLTIKLGSKEFSLKPQQVMAMRDMCDYLTE